MWVHRGQRPFQVTGVERIVETLEEPLVAERATPTSVSPNVTGLWPRSARIVSYRAFDRDAEDNKDSLESIVRLRIADSGHWIAEENPQALEAGLIQFLR
jgi:hypothetical protein